MIAMVKKLRVRAAPEHSQAIRLGAQLLFVALNVWIGVRFVQWVRWIELTRDTPVQRPAGVEGWLPIAGLMNLRAWIATGRVPAVHPAAMFLLVAFVAMSILLRRSFCSWLCPIGTLSEMLWKLGRRFGANVALPKVADIPLRGIKYLLFTFFAWTILRMPAGAIEEFMSAPYGVTADIRLLHFFRFMSTTALVVVAVLVALSIVVRNFWCRYLCPYGALLSVASLLSPASITRDPRECIDCAKCAKACPSRLPVDVLPRVRSAECTMCMSCVAVCPAAGALEVKAFGRKRLPAWSVAAIVFAVFFAVVIAARVSGRWEQQIADETVRYFLQ